MIFLFLNFQFSVPFFYKQSVAQEMKTDSESRSSDKLESEKLKSEHGAQIEIFNEFLSLAQKKEQLTALFN